MKATVHVALRLILLFFAGGRVVADDFELLFDGKSLADFQGENGAHEYRNIRIKVLAG
tara:strand:+ start:416 stop:589 length:174 start_codon:yes stop_codon:yes gene_type:complete